MLPADNYLEMSLQLDNYPGRRDNLSTSDEMLLPDDTISGALMTVRPAVL